MTTRDKIQDILAQLTVLKNKKAHYESLKTEREEVIIEQNEAAVIVDKELADIMALENLSVRSIIRRVAGDKEEELSEERKEYLEASLILKEINERLDLIDFEMSVLQDNMGDPIELEKKLDYLIDLRFKELLADNGISKIEFQSLQEELVANEKMLSEVHEAYESLIEYKYHIDDMLNRLKTAGYWFNFGSHTGRRKMMIELNNALVAYPKCRIKFHKLKAELRDINLNYELDDIYIEISNKVYVRDLLLGHNYGSQISKTIKNFKKYRTHTFDLEKAISNVEFETKQEIERITKRFREVVISS